MAEPAADIAAVIIETGLLHLDRPFDYRVPAALKDHVRLGSHVRVRFAGRLVSGWVVDLRSHTDHQGRLATVERVVGTMPVMTADTIALCRAVATRYVGTFADVVRAAVPPRHAAAEGPQAHGSDAMSELALASPGREPGGQDGSAVGDELLRADGGADAGARSEPPTLDERDAHLLSVRYPGLAHAISEGQRVCVTVGPGGRGHALVAAAAVMARARGSVLVVVPDSRDIAGISAEIRSRLGDGHGHQLAVLTAESGRAVRWRTFQRVLGGGAGIVLGTRAAVFAPLASLGTIIVWDDGDDSHDEPHAPYWHTREVAALRSHEQSCGLILCGVTESVESAALVQRGWLRRVTPQREWVRSAAPRVMAQTSEELERDPWARATTVPAAAIRHARDALADGPVLVLTPRRGYARTTWCRACGQLRTCTACGRPAALRQEALQCPACDLPCASACPACGGTALRAGGIGQDRIAEEMGRALPGVRVVISNVDKRVTEVPGTPALVCATAGCEPFTAAGYAAVVVLDVSLLLGGPGSDAEVEGLRRMLHAASSARPGAPVVVAGDASSAPVQALIRWDPCGFAERVLRERTEVHLPPAGRAFVLSGAVADLLAVAQSIELPRPSQVVNPHAVPGADHRMVITVPWQRGATVAASLREALALRQAGRTGGPVQVKVDPRAL